MFCYVGRLFALNYLLSFYVNGSHLLCFSYRLYFFTVELTKKKILLLCCSDIAFSYFLSSSYSWILWYPPIYVLNIEWLLLDEKAISIYIYIYINIKYCFFGVNVKFCLPKKPIYICILVWSNYTSYLFLYYLLSIREYSQSYSKPKL